MFLTATAQQLELQEQFDAIYLRVQSYKRDLKRSLKLLEELYRTLMFKTFDSNVRIEKDEVDQLMEDDIQLELFLNSINASGFETAEEYDSHMKLLHRILDRTKLRNKENPDYLKGIVQSLKGDIIILETNKEHKYRKRDETA